MTTSGNLWNMVPFRLAVEGVCCTVGNASVKFITSRANESIIVIVHEFHKGLDDLVN